MNLRKLTEHALFRPAAGAALAVVCGMTLLFLPVNARWQSASYDTLLLFGSPKITNNVVVILMDKDAHDVLHQERGNWERAEHAKLLNRLADDKCPLVVMDVHFGKPREPASADLALAEALQRQRAVVLMADLAEGTTSRTESMRPLPPIEPFLSGAKSNWGVGHLDADPDQLVRRHWPFPSPGPYPSLPWMAAKLAGAKLPGTPTKQWIHYYGENGTWENLSYHFAYTKETNYFHDKIVFIGSKPVSTGLDGEPDKFQTPYRPGYAIGGVQILVTEFLNLVNHDWWRRFPWPAELLLLITSGVVLGAGLGRVRPLVATLLAVAAAILVSLFSILLTHATDIWFPWLIIVGGQVPCSLAWSVVTGVRRRVVEVPTVVVGPTGTVLITGVPSTPDYELFEPPLGEGAFGKVWLVRNAIGQWQALKAVYAAKFGEERKPYESEFKGIKRYKPISDKHPALLRVDFVSKMKREGYFYYVMELGDSEVDGWQENPSKFQARDLASVCRRAPRGRIAPVECLKTAVTLAEALDFLHRQKLLHRDIKPNNVIFVNGSPKLADIGLVTDIRPPEEVQTWAGTAGFMPPPPEPPGTVQADIYAFGMTLFVISTSRQASFYPALRAALGERSHKSEFARLDAIILKACNPDLAERYKTAAEMLHDLQVAMKAQPAHSA